MGGFIDDDGVFNEANYAVYCAYEVYLTEDFDINTVDKLREFLELLADGCTDSKYLEDLEDLILAAI